MARALFPFYCFPTPAAAKLIGDGVAVVALLALRAALREGQGLDIAHQQIRYGGHDLAFSTRVNVNGDVVIEIDIGDPNLRDRVVLEGELRREGRRVRGIRDEDRAKRDRGR